MSIRGKATNPLNAGRWSFASFVLSQTIGSLLYLPLARLLTPDDFGLIAAAGLIVTGLTLVAEVALTRSLIRLSGDRDELARAVLALSIIGGLLAAALCAVLGWPVAVIFDEPELRQLLPLMSLSILFTSLGTVPHALLSRELDFRRKTLPETVSIGTGGLVALLAALAGAGVYSLVFYALIRTFLSSAVAWYVIDWRPSFRRPDTATMRRVLSFGLPASGGDLALYARLNADYAIVGRRLGADQLGVYSLAWTCAVGPAALITSFFGGVGYATFARLQRDRDRLRAIYLAATRLIASVALPLFLGAVFLRYEIVVVLYGERWLGMVGPLLPLFLLQSLREVCRPGASLTLATGHNRLYAACGLIALPLTVIAVLVGSRYGIVGVAWAVLIAVGASSIVWPSIAIAVLRPSVAELWRAIRGPLLLTASSTPMVIIVRVALEATPAPTVLRLIAAILAGAAGFGVALYLLRDSFLADLARLKEPLPEEEATASERLPSTTPPLSVSSPATLAVPAADG
ncbi:MAG: oligosaccharide flippase family protein [Dehalococcoidia bacterium]